MISIKYIPSFLYQKATAYKGIAPRNTAQGLIRSLYQWFPRRSQRDRPYRRRDLRFVPFILFPVACINNWQVSRLLLLWRSSRTIPSCDCGLRENLSARNIGRCSIIMEHRDWTTSWGPWIELHARCISKSDGAEAFGEVVYWSAFYRWKVSNFCLMVLVIFLFGAWGEADGEQVCESGNKK